MFAELSVKAKELIFYHAGNRALCFGAKSIQPEHVMLAILVCDDVGIASLAVNYLEASGFDKSALLSLLEKKLGPYRTHAVVLPQKLAISPRMKTVLSIAAIEAESLKSSYVGTEHILIALTNEIGSETQNFLRETGFFPNKIAPMVKKIYALDNTGDMENISGIPRDQWVGDDFDPPPKETREKQQKLISNLLNNINSSEASGSRSHSKPQPPKSLLTEYGKDMTKAAADGENDPIIGRRDKIHRLVQIFARRTKNNPILVGEPGVGKTAIVEGLAAQIAGGNVPPFLQNKRIISLDMAQIVAGTKYRGEFEQRIKAILKEISAQKNIIVFIDEIHTIIGAGGPEGTLDASNILKPALGRGELQCIGATTNDEYRKYFEKDGALERRFHKVPVEEPTEEETREILLGIKAHYENFHGIHYTEDSIESILKLAKCYITDRCFPDKAIDILDEAGALKRVRNQEEMPEIFQLERSLEDLSKSEKYFSNLQEYESAKDVFKQMEMIRHHLDILKENLANNENSTKVTTDDIKKIISTMTGIPVEGITAKENRRLLNMEKEIHRSLVGQEEAVSVVSRAIRRSRVGVSSKKRPIGAFLFLGPTGVGKTLLAKSLARFLFNDEKALIRVDMSDFMEKHNSSKLVGAPPGYVGHEEGGSLTEKVRQKPYSVILLDEIEKAHPDIFNMLLQVFEEGELADGLGHTVNFRNTVVIMTSNVGARQIIGDKKIGFSKIENQLSKDEIRSSAMEELKKIMNPEMINRLDDIVVFSPLSPEQIEEIVDLQLEEMRERLAEIGDELKISSAAKKYFSENGYESQYGARPIRRLLQKKVEDVIADRLLKLDGKKVLFSIGVKNGDIHISAKVQKGERDFNPSGLLPLTQNSQMA